LRLCQGDFGESAGVEVRQVVGVAVNGRHGMGPPSTASSSAAIERR
jgi:hypothetical protein